MTRANVRAAVPRGHRIAVCAIATAAIALALPAIASAKSTVFVSPEPVKGPFSSCATPGYNSIQEAITISGSGTTIHVCAGTYTEQVVMQKPDNIAADPGATLKLPVAPAATKSPCDSEPEEQDLFMVCTGGKVSISGLTLDGAWPTGTCNDNLYTLNTGGGVKLTLAGSKVLHAGAVPINGCQGGIGVAIGRKLTGQVATAKLTNDVVEGYQKGGIKVDGPGSSAKLVGVTVSGVGATPEIAQNGIQISRGAKASISGSTVTGNECNNAVCGPNAQTQTQSAGVLLFEQASGVKVSSSNISKNDIGVYNATGNESVSAKISNNTLEEDRFEGIVLEEGAAQVNGNNIIGNGKANVGIQLLQFEEDKVGVKATGKSDAISGMTKCAVEGSSDVKAADKLETLSLKNSLAKFSGNAQPLCNNNEAKILISLT
jgi:hypothetical protein